MSKILHFIFLFFFALISLNFINSEELDSNQYFELAKKEAKANNFQKATLYCEKALKIAPKDMDIKEFLGKCYMETGQLMKAKVTLLQVLDTSPNRVDARSYLVNIEMQQKNYSSAICYVNELLEITPYSKDLWIKKINLYNIVNNKIEAQRETKRLYLIFPNDTTVVKMYNNILKENALTSSKSNDFSEAINIYNQVLKNNPKDHEVHLNLINSYLKSGNLEAAKIACDNALFFFPNNIEIINKKVGVLYEQKNYVQAIEFLKLQMKTNYDASLRKNLIFMTEEAARFYKNTDPYELHQQVYELTKSQESYNYLLNTAISRGYYEDAQRLISIGLKSNPNSKKLLLNQLTVYHNTNNDIGAQNLVYKMHLLFPTDNEISEKYVLYQFKQGKIDFQDRNYKAAFKIFDELKTDKTFGLQSKRYLYNILLEQKKYDDAEYLIDQLIYENQEISEFKMNKVDLLASKGEYKKAYSLVLEYYIENKKSEEFKYILDERALEYIKHLNENEEYELASTIASNMFSRDIHNLQSYLYLINARLAMHEYKSALSVVDTALIYYPSSKELYLKKSIIYENMNDYDNAVSIMLLLNENHPHTLDYKKRLNQLYINRGDLYSKNNQNDSAMIFYQQAAFYRQTDTLAPLKISQVYLKQNESDSAMFVIDQALKKNPSSHTLLYQKGYIYETKNVYDSAYMFQRKYKPTYEELNNHHDHLDYLSSKSLKNQINIGYLHASFDDITYKRLSVATIEYTNFSNKNNALVGRINYTGRNEGMGIQSEIDWYHTFKNKSNFLATVGVSNLYFPKFKVNFSYYQPTNNDWEMEIGGRFAKLQDQTNLLTGILGVRKDFEKAWFSGRYFLLSDFEELFHNVQIDSKIYTSKRKSYVQVLASVGTAPVEQKLDFQYNTMISYLNTMIGGGYTYNINYKTSIGFIANWYNYKINSGNYVNQYNLFINLKTKF